MESTEASTAAPDPRCPRTVIELMNHWSPGSQDDGWTWADEGRDLLDREPHKMRRLQDSILIRGLREALPDEEPITLGNDGRVWAGHHRICAAALVNLDLPLPADLYLVPTQGQGDAGPS